MASEDQAILAKISQLAGQINKHKNSQTSDHQTQYMPSMSANTYPSMESQYFDKHTANGSQDYAQPSAAWAPSRGGYSSRGHRGRGRGRGAGHVHRNRTLVLNSSTSASEDSLTSQFATNDNPKTAPAWVTKTDRHLQLINTNIFEKDSQIRAKAMEETRKQKLMQRDAREKSKFSKHLQRLAVNNYGTIGPQSHSATARANYEINVQGIQFRVAKNGSKLVKVPGERPPTAMENNQGDVCTQEPDLLRLGDLNAANATPKTALIGGVRFYRSKNGNMYRSGIVKAHRYERLPFKLAWMPLLPCNTNLYDTRKNAVIKKINEPCKMFTTTGICSKGPKCRYIHDASKVAVCKDFLLKGSCPSGELCDLSHDLTPERTPNCLHFARGNCSNANCRYTHVRVSPSALVCRPFAIYGYCEKGTSCEDRHIHECPDFSNTGTCTTKGCKLPHRHKASVMRTNPSRGDVSAEDESSDLSSDEDEEIDDDDVDSDDLDEEYFGEDGKPDAESMQQDYVQLS
ncbi:Zinc finger CCCH domain-containing protein [Lachnellula cervina]|uniref:Zinc finger CCCH domain-containing protein n=1 Tax=Lachnellula cervina TaxID=1316786 RepID=A0A7D8YVW3_9HELO|nr:Zinc finger CCCH domain-containing protein [Lachnellula cervina]